GTGAWTPWNPCSSSCSSSPTTCTVWVWQREGRSSPLTRSSTWRVVFWKWSTRHFQCEKAVLHEAGSGCPIDVGACTRHGAVCAHDHWLSHHRGGPPAGSLQAG